MVKLNSRQEAFCREYLVDMNATQAAIRAKYSAKTAQEQSSRLLSNVIVQQRISELKQERCQRTQIDADWVLMSAKRVFDRCMQDEPVLDREGKQVMTTTADGELAAAYTFNATGANKALETIGKHVNVNAFGTQKEEVPKDEQITKVVVEVVGANQDNRD
jgi:phage terminase small subunit